MLRESQEKETVLFANNIHMDVSVSRIHFQTLLKSIQQTNWKNHLTESVKKYSWESYKLMQLGPKNIEKIYQKVSLKYKNNERQRMTWHQNELRMFIWLLASAPGIFNLIPDNYRSQELKQLSLPFFGIHSDLCQYQFKSLISPQLFRAWEAEEDILINEILKNHTLEGSWSNIAKQLFLQSDKKYFRTPQSCRQRWQNHLDDRKVRGKWTAEEDLLLIKHILSEGKRWSVIAKKIGETRTQHMVKNRFQTILRRQFKAKKKPVRFSEEHQFCKELAKKLTQKITEQSSKFLIPQNNTLQSFRSIAKITPNDLLCVPCEKTVSPSTSSFSYAQQLKQVEPLHYFSSFCNPSISSLANIRQQQQSQHENSMNLYKNQSKEVFDPLQQSTKSLQCVQKSFAEKIETQLELEIPLFIDEIIFGNQYDDMISSFFKESRIFE